MKTAQITVLDEPNHEFGSSDNERTYPNELLIEPVYMPASIHGVFIDEVPFAVIGAGGGPTGIHNNSLLLFKELAFVAVGDQVIAISLKEKRIKWHKRIDDATCFGLYYSEKHQALISHGELNVSRFTESGELLWQSSGGDVFSEGFELTDEWIEVVDFDGLVNHFCYLTGNELKPS